MVLQIIGIILGTLVGLFILELAIVALIPGFSAPEQRLETNEQTPHEVNEDSSHLKKDVSFEVNETAVSAWLYLPENSPGPYPCIIMAHGFGGTRDLGLEPYAVRFQKAGYAEPIYYPIGHFDIYNGENFESSVNDQLKFFKKHL